MELLLLKIVAFLRPILLIEVGTENFFDIAAMLTFGLLAFTFFTKAAAQRSLDLNLMDVLVAAFAFWSVCVYFVYFEISSARSLAKLIIPFFTYTVARNVLRGNDDYAKVLLLMIIGYLPPVLLSAGLIATGHGMEAYGKNYWTGIQRWAGAFSGSHDLGHNMTFVLMAMVVFWVAWREQPGKGPLPPLLRAIFVILGAAALYCLWMSQVRTALFGLVLFSATFLYFTNRKLLLVSTIAGGVTVTALMPLLYPYLFPDLVMIDKGAADESYIASGRPVLWENNWQRFLQLPLDRQLGGIGIGNKAGEEIYTGEGFTDSHNDFLEVLLHTGVVGFVLFVALQFVFLKNILRLQGRSKYVFIALFVAVTAMNFASNSYVSRFGLAQMYYILLAYVGLRVSAVGREAQRLTEVPVGTRTAAGPARSAGQNLWHLPTTKY